MKRILVTGGAGFVGSHLVESVLADDWSVTVVDNFDPYYDPSIKRKNLSAVWGHPRLRLEEKDIRDREALDSIAGDFDVIVHLAAKAGVRPSIQDPIGYQDTNVKGTQNVLELARRREIPQFIFASSSSVYGVNPNVPWSEEDHVLRPISPYASTKVSGELLGHVYSHLYGVRFLALRFFTVYGPRQRPDLAIHKFARLILEGETIPVYGDGSTRRDYTYVSDIIQGIRGAMAYQDSLYEVVNLGNDQTVSLSQMVQGLESVLNRQALITWLPDQPGDVPQTWARIEKAKELIGYCPATSFPDGLAKFAQWLTAGDHCVAA